MDDNFGSASVISLCSVMWLGNWKVLVDYRGVPYIKEKWNLKNEIHLKSCDLSDVDKVCVGDFRDQ